MPSKEVQRTAVKPVRRVVVNGYTYETDLDVKVGDKVLLPTADFLRDVKGPTWEGTVSSLTSDYTGPCVWILSIIEKK